MASASASDEAAWHEGDLCLAPRSHDGILTEATIHRLTSSSHDNDTAWVIFTEGEEQEEEAVPVRKLLRPGLNQLCQEKPVFPGSSIQPSLCIPLNLSDEDRVPYTINRYLRDYQREGISFIYNNYINSTGCILGDDMGLGKTVQVIGFLAAVLHKTGTWEDIEKNRPQFLQSQISSEQSVPSKVFLIVAPLSVLYNWKDELDTWGNFHCVVVHGLRKEEELARIKKGRTEIALTTYETLRLCLDQFNKVDWSAVFVDEAHKIKNPNSQITQAMKALRCKIRIGLTGTILQNNLEELWCVMDWAVPGCLGSLGHFKNHFSDPIEQGQRHSATKRSLATARKTVHALMRKISHLFLRRTKALIQKQLPKKDDRVVYCSLTDFQQEVYRAVLDCEDVTLLLRSSEKCDCQSGRTRTSCCYKKNSEGVLIKELYFSYLTILRKVANHAALLQSTQSTSKKQEKYVSAVCAKVFHKFPEFVERCRTEAFEALSDPVYSGKMRVLQKLLKYYLQRRDKVLIFSLSTKLLDVLERYCMAEGLDYSRLDGSTKSKERVQIVKDFNSSSHINLCLVSTMAGGLGLNFVGANVVVLFDPTWNPANDLQAIDRAYRIGQCRDVTVLRLISLGTVEEVIYLRQVYKQQLQSSVVGKESARRYFEAVQGSDAYNGELFGIPNLFRLQTEGTCLTRRILEREGRIEAGVMTTRTQRGSEEEEETKRNSEPGGPLLHAEAAKTNRDSSQVSRDVLDFSSGSETDDEEVQKLKRKASNQRRDGDGNSGKVNTSRGWMSLLQHGFSRLLERVSKRAELEEVDSSSCAEESPSEEDAAADDQKIDQTSPGLSKPSSAGNCVLFPLKSGIITQDGSSGSDKKHDDNGEKIFLSKEEDVAVRRRWTQKRCKDKQTAVDDTSDGDSSPDNKKAHKLQTSVPKVKNFDSDESDDFNLETTTGSKKYDLNCYKKGRDRGKGTSHKGRKHRVCGKNKSRSRYTENIETFTSSEDELTPSTGRGEEMGKKASFTNLKKQRSPSSNETKRTIDCVLGDVHEVVYTHSNQRVVGGSKAEELISRAAVRDVFERKIHSQFPANHLPVTQESLPTSLPDSHPHSTSVKLQKHNEDHPVTFTSKSLHHTGCTTVIIGETPKAIRRQQLEEMAAKFQFPSVRQFATEILRRNSPLRLSWLRQYYTSLSSSDVAETVTENFPEPDSAQTATSAPSAKTAAKNHHADNTKQQKESSRTPNSVKYTQRNPKPQTKPDSPQNNVSLPQIRSGNLQNDVPQPPKKQKILRKNVQDPLWDNPGPESDKQEEMVCSARGRMSTKKSSVSNPGAHRAGGGLGVDRASCSGLGSGEAAAFLNRTDRDIPSSSSSDLGCRSSAVSSKSAAQETEQEQKSQPRTSETSQRRSENAHPPSTYNRSLLIDLIGDTSILDDLLKAKPKKTQQNTPTSPSTSSLSVNTSHVTSPSSNRTFSNLKEPASHRVSEPVQAAKSGCRDIWDILNEGNEESINKLTDPKELQRVCVDSSSAVRRVSEQRETKSLWKTNDKFLWKK